MGGWGNHSCNPLFINGGGLSFKNFPNKRKGEGEGVQNFSTKKGGEGGG